MRIKNSTGGSDIFAPIDENNVRMYFCGPTVYDRVHIGNIRSFLFADLMYRVLKYKYPKVTYVRNITDIDDKIIERVVSEKRDFNEFIEEKISLFHKDLSDMNILRPDVEPRATEHLGDMFEMIETLIERDYAYISNGSVYFDVEKYPEGVKIFNRNITEAESRIGENSDKRNDKDFALWKHSEDEYSWFSPWGKGRPGWHIECSAMAKRYLGEHFDIHGGGIDLQFPHHTNENTQSVCSSHDEKTSMANFWVHTKMLRVNGKKMSKSEGSKIYISDLLETYSSNIIRLYFYVTKYNEDFDFDYSHLNNFNRNMNNILLNLVDTPKIDIQDSDLEEGMKYIDDDFNIYPLISTYIYKLYKGDDKDKNIAIKLLELLGVDFSIIEKPSSNISEDEIKRLISERDQFRKDKNWYESDKIRKLLENKNVYLKDSIEGTTWEIRYV